jgi:hypothetical protein
MNLLEELVWSQPERVKIDANLGDHIPLAEFRELQRTECLIPWDGTGHYATETHEFPRTDPWRDEPPEGTTHVMWYNK